MPASQPAVAVAPAARGPWWKAPYLHLALSILLSAAAQLLNKRGADESVTGGAVFGFQGLGSPWVWGGIVCMILSLLSWLHALRTAPLHIAFNLTGAIHVIVPLSSWLLLGEAINGMRWLGIALICAGVVITARQVGEVEERL
jgi:undecaprenyl phosphate-alpha-L-ara4N flippase subunit ArnE